MALDEKEKAAIVEAVGFSVFSGGKTLLDAISLRIEPGQITAIIGPANSGKSLFLRCINRLSELDRTVSTQGTLKVLGHDVHAAGMDVATLRRKVGMVFSKPTLPVAGELSSEHQQRLCIARALAAEPVLLLFDEPTAHLDFPSAGHIEDLICQLARSVPVVIAAQTPQQASHIADTTAFILGGRLVEFGSTVDVLTNPKHAQTEAYVTGRLG
jgi:phosphate transport system ATP-binding protein